MLTSASGVDAPSLSNSGGRCSDPRAGGRVAGLPFFVWHSPAGLGLRGASSGPLIPGPGERPPCPIRAPARGPSPGGSRWGGASHVFVGWAMGTFEEGAAWVLRFQRRAPLARRRRLLRCRERNAPGARGRTGPTFPSSLSAAVRRCRKRRRVLTCALILSATRLRGEIHRGPATR